MNKEYIKEITGRITQIFPEVNIKVADENRKLFFSSNFIPSGKTRRLSRVKVALPEKWMLSVELAPLHGETSGDISRMIRGLVSLIDESEIRAWADSMPQNTQSFLANHLLFATTPENIAYIVLSGLDLGYDLTLRRVVCVLDIVMRKVQTSAADNTLRSIVHMLRTFSASSQDIAVQLSDNQIALCTRLINDRHTVKEQISGHLVKICSILSSRYGVSVTIGVGNPPGGLGEYNTSLAEAKAALRYARIFGHKHKVCFITDYVLESEISRLPSGVLEHFFGKYCSIIDSYDQLGETIKALVQNEMNVQAAADAAFIHRNTMLFRIHQIKKLFGINPLHNDSDRFFLMALYIYYKLSRESERPL
jgi:sugar diacid utilization regulator